MNAAILAFAVLMHLCIRPATAQQIQAVEPTAIRDIRAPLPTAGLPPFAGTILILLAGGLGLVMIIRDRSEKTGPTVFPPVASRELSDLAFLRDAYERQELSADLLFCHLSSFARSRLVQSDNGTLTNVELLKAVSDNTAAEIVFGTTELFALCDRVRFGAYQPEMADIDVAFAMLQKLLDYPPGSLP